MTVSVVESDNGADKRVSNWTRWLAGRTPRRSFLGRAGRGLVASSVGGTAALAVFAESAYAANCGCCCSESVSCGCLTGTNGCPSGTCECGSWITCGTQCGHNAMYWHDCCNESYHSSYCDGGCSNRPVNCFSKEWSGGCTTGYTIRCRYYRCDSSGPQPC